MVMEKKHIYISLVSLVVFIMANQVTGNKTIGLIEYQWKNRLLLLFTPSLDEPRYQDLKKALTMQEEEVMDRDLLVFHIVENGQTRLGNSPLSESSGDYLREKFSTKSGTFTVLLIGKDGGVKLRREGRVKLKEIFSLIDSMSMRQREMREKSQQR
jgi:hypothetical protein